MQSTVVVIGTCRYNNQQFSNVRGLLLGNFNDSLWAVVNLYGNIVSVVLPVDSPCRVPTLPTTRIYESYTAAVPWAVKVEVKAVYDIIKQADWENVPVN